MGFTALLLTGLLTVTLWFSALPGVGSLFAGSPPDTLGLQGSSFAPCPPSPNCVNSQAPATDTVHAIAPISYSGAPRSGSLQDRRQAQADLLKVLTVVPRTEVVETQDDYIYAQSRSRLLGFVDDLEFYFPPDTAHIELRSASRLGESDLGVNRRRMEQIRLAFADFTEKNKR